MFYNMFSRPASTKPSIQVNQTSSSWRENSKTVNGINWDEKPEKVDLYSKNIEEDDETSEVVDCESIADLSSTRSRWESFYRSTSNEPLKPAIKKNSTTTKHWEVKLPYKSDNHPPITSPREVSPDKMSENDIYANESAIDREIRLANEREEMLRQEQEERLALQKRQSESKQNFENKSNNNNKEFQTMYHEMTEADRGSELQKRETIIQQEIMENEEREKALKDKFNQDDTEDESTEGVIEKEIRLQKERENEMASHHTNGQAHVEEITYEEAIGTFQHEGESLIARELRELREREEELQKQRNSLQQMSLNTSKSQPVTPTVQKTSTPPVQKTESSPVQQKPPTPRIQKQSFNSFLSSQNATHEASDESENQTKKATKKETPIEREIRLARERENELRLQKGLPLLPESKPVDLEPDNTANDDDDDISYNRYNSKSDTPSMRQFSSSRLQNELQRQKEREMIYRKEGKIITTSEEHIEPMKFTEVPTKITGPVKRNFVINKTTTVKSPEENGDVEVKENKPVVTSPEQNKEEPKFRLKTGGAAFSYRETRQHAESKIEKELREMREREEELKKQRRSSGLILDS